MKILQDLRVMGSFTQRYKFKAFR